MKIALGTVQFGCDYGIANKRRQVQDSEVAKIISNARSSGINLLDTAVAYGSSENVLGRVGVGGFNVVTKLPADPKVSQSAIGQWVKTQVYASLARLRRDTLYALLLHQPQILLTSHGAEVSRALSDLKNDGVVQKIGVSVYSPDELPPIFSKYCIDLVQVPLNVADRRMETSGWLERLHNEGVEVHSRSTFLQGLLLMGRNELPGKFLRWSRLWEEWESVLMNSGVTALEACLAYPLSIRQVDHVLVGVDGLNHLRAILKAANRQPCNLDTSFMMSADLDLIHPPNWTLF